MTMTTAKLPLVLCILDGWGWAEPSAHNSIHLAKTPTWDKMLKKYPHSRLDASAHAVGLPPGQMGNSEVGHMTIGSGRIIMQDLPRIDAAIQSQDIFKRLEWQNFIDSLRRSKSTCHIMGLLSPGGIHAHTDHWWAMLEALNTAKVPVILHPFLDGRDTSPKSALEYLNILEQKRKNWPLCKWGSIGGRYFAMDRDKRWERTEQAYQTIVHAKGPKFENALEYVKSSYQLGITDEFIIPAAEENYSGFKAHDCLLMMNFRADRMRQLLSSLFIPNFTGFKCRPFMEGSYLGMTEYAESFKPFIKTLFSPQPTEEGLGELVAKAGLKQLRAAETEKYAHVTFFFNGGREAPYEGEDRILIPSPAVATYDLCPEMSAAALTTAITDAISSQKYQLIIVNFANADMVGHTGNIPAAIQAVETIDRSLKALEEACLEYNHWMLITADHGNIEMMFDETVDSPHTAHTCNEVPCVLVGKHTDHFSLMDGGLQDITPTILNCLGLELSTLMTGHSLLKRA